MSQVWMLLVTFIIIVFWLILENAKSEKINKVVLIRLSIAFSYILIYLVSNIEFSIGFIIVTLICKHIFKKIKLDKNTVKYKWLLCINIITIIVAIFSGYKVEEDFKSTVIVVFFVVILFITAIIGLKLTLIYTRTKFKNIVNLIILVIMMILTVGVMYFEYWALVVAILAYFNSFFSVGTVKLFTSKSESLINLKAKKALEEKIEWNNITIRTMSIAIIIALFIDEKIINFDNRFEIKKINMFDYIFARGGRISGIAIFIFVILLIFILRIKIYIKKEYKKTIEEVKNRRRFYRVKKRKRSTN